MTLSTREKAKLVWDTFVNRTDVFAMQHKVPSRGVQFYPVEHCPLEKPCGRIRCQHHDGESYEPLTPDHIVKHLNGEITVGVYQLSDDNKVKWMCLDVDIVKSARVVLDAQTLKDNVEAHTMALAREAHKNIGKNTFLVERSGSKGYHLWFFFAQPIEARYAYTLAAWLESKVPPPPGVHVETFPKQIQLQKFGSLVKLPLGIHKKTDARCFFITGAFEPHVDQWAVLQNVKRLTTVDVINILAKNRVQPTNVRRRDERIEVGSGNGSVPCMTRVMHEGLSDGNRDTGMFALAIYLKDKGLPTSATESVLETVNEQTKPPLDRNYLQSKVDSAYSAAYSIFYPCGKPEFDDFCSSSCKFWKNKVENRWTKYGKPENAAKGVISRD